MRAENLVRRADRWVFASEDARRLAAVRIGLCCLLALRLTTRDYGAIAVRNAHFPPYFYMSIFERLPSQDIAVALQIGGVVAALVAAGGLALRVSLPVAVVCSLLLNGIVNSGGRVIVGDALLTLCLLVLVASGTAAREAWAVRTRPSTQPVRGARYGWPIRTAMIAIALAYFFAGLQKWRYSGMPWVTSDNLRWILYGQTHPDGMALFVADRPLLTHVLAAGSLLLETSFPLVLFFPRLRWVFIPAAAAMHIGIRLAIGLDYSAQWLALLIVFVNWPIVVDQLRRAVTTVPAPREVSG